MTHIPLPLKPYKMELLGEQLKSITGSDGATRDGKGNTYALFLDPMPEGAVTQALTIANAHDASQPSTREQTRNAIRTVLQGAAGKAWETLTAAEVRAVVAVFLYEHRALNADGTVKPPSDWVR